MAAVAKKGSVYRTGTGIKSNILRVPATYVPAFGPTCLQYWQRAGILLNLLGVLVVCRHPVELAWSTGNDTRTRDMQG